MSFYLTEINTDTIVELATNYGMKLLGALIIIIIGFIIANKLAKLIGKKMKKSEKMTSSMRSFLQSLIGVCFKIMVLLAAMATAGFEVTAFIAVLGGLAIGIGMALQGSLSNLAGGILIIFFKPFKDGDVIESLGNIGVVSEITILHTILLTPDMRTVILPNGSVFNNPVINYSKHGIRRVDIGIGISYSDDFEGAKQVLLKVLDAEPLILDDKDKLVEIKEFGDNSVNLQMHGYAKTENYLGALFSLNSATKKALDENGYNIPFPQRDIHIISQPEK